MLLMATTDIDDRLTGQLRDRGMRVTSQRLLIHRTLCGEPQHLTAEQVLASVSELLPGTSLPTVYSTLELLEELGLVRRVARPGGAVLFDSRTEPHAHTVCRRCGELADLDARASLDDAFDGARLAGFAPENAELLVRGLCRRCQNGR